MTRSTFKGCAIAGPALPVAISVAATTPTAPDHARRTLRVIPVLKLDMALSRPLT
ncbi:hypothetical protein [Roseateles sp. L2-2]|uniref:hypothetical protein n=1 Tax=Roseateles sp. L2-2 TaxID=3422597 RepID=UPI003D35B47D